MIHPNGDLRLRLTTVVGLMPDPHGVVMELNNIRILITGGTRGIGRALALQLHKEGARVLVCGARASSARKFTEETGLDAVVCDVTECEDVRALAEVVLARLGHLDVLINCAGLQEEEDVLRGVDMEAVEREIAVNLTGPIRVTNALIDQLLESPRPVIVNITSVLAWAPKRSAPVYCATKAGLSSWTRGLRAQLASRSVRVVEVVPPLVATDMTSGRDDGAIEPEQVATAIVAGLRREREMILVGKSRLARLVWRLAPGVLERGLLNS